MAWVRDRQDAQVHLLITSQQTGAGGRENTLAFIGLQDMASVSDTLLQVSSPTDTDAEEREQLTSHHWTGADCVRRPYSPSGSHWT